MNNMLQMKKMMKNPNLIIVTPVSIGVAILGNKDSLFLQLVPL